MTAAAENGHITPLYQSTPAPVGLAEYGLRTNASGDVLPFILNTTTVRATFDTPSVGGPNATYLLNSLPDSYGVQLNSVVTNVTLFGQSGYQFWTQNVMIYVPYVGEMFLETNVWNWSSPAEFLSPNVFYAHGPNGTQDGTTFYYASTGGFHVSYPFNLTQTLVSNLTDGRQSVYFSANITSPSGNFSFPNYDYVIFNSLASTTPALTAPAVYSANGFAFNAIGSTNDFELTIGGPGSGSQTTLLTANATESLDYWNASSRSFEAVPSAYTYGGETGETSIGASMAWATASSGTPYGIMTTGPSFLGGLWNASSPSGGPGHLEITVRPSNAFVFVTPEVASTVNVSSSEWAPTVNTASFTLAAGSFALTLVESDYNPLFVGPIEVTAGSSIHLTENLVRNTSRGIYTPLWAWTNGQIANLSTAGSGSQADPYQIVNQQTSPMLPPFGLLNDIGFPVFPGVYFLRTSAYTEFANPAPLQAYVTTNSGKSVPSLNELPWWFYDDANIAVTGAQNISGWFVSSASSYPRPDTQFLAFNVVIINSTGFLIARDSFQTESRALLLAGGTDNVVWGNTFAQLSPPSPSTYLVPSSDGIGLAVQEGGDLIYNNLFASTPITATSPDRGLYGSNPETFTNSWNITTQSASNAHEAVNWPTYPLTGSVIGTAVQGGNFWWDYGMTLSPYLHSNPYNVLPYNESTEIATGGDAAPLLYSPLYTVQLVPSGLGPADSWYYSVRSAANLAEQFGSGTASGTADALVYLTTAPIGRYELVAGTAGQYRAPIFDFTVSGNSTVAVGFLAEYGATFTESGLPPGTRWSVDLNGTTSRSTNETITFYFLVNDSYSFAVRPVPGYDADPANGTMTIAGADGAQAIVFTALPPATYPIAFSESGLPAHLTWGVTIGSTLFTVGAGLSVTTNLTNGTYSYSVIDVPGWHQATLPTTGAFTVNGSAVTEPTLAFSEVLYSISFLDAGLPGGVIWGVTVNGTLYTTTSPVPLTVSVPNGTYAYAAGPAGSYLPQSGAVGRVQIAGGSASVTVTYADSYLLIFSENGLPAKLIWSVNVTGPGGASWQNYSFGSTITFRLTNATYSYRIVVPDGYSVSPSSGSVTIQGAAIPVPPVSIGLSATSPASFPWLWAVVGIVILLLVVGIVAAWARRRRRPGP